MSAYYNEFDPKKAAWLRELIKQGHIAPGEVDERSIKEVKASDIAGFKQCHFFAGIGVWSHALRNAGWPDDREVWTGSCPCQSFSVAGKRKGFSDERHLWPDWYRLISERQPSVIFGEQSASKDALAWLDLVRDNLEASNYAFGALDICGPIVGAPHIRQRLYFAADRLDNSSIEGFSQRSGKEISGKEACCLVERPSDTERLGDTNEARLEKWNSQRCNHGAQCSSTERADGNAGRMADTDGWDSSAERKQRSLEYGQQSADGSFIERMDDAAGARCDGALGITEGNPWNEARLCLPFSGCKVDGLEYSSLPEEARLTGERIDLLGEGCSTCGLEQSRGERWQWRQAPTPGYDDHGSASERSQGEHGACVSSPCGDRPKSAGPTNGFWNAPDWLFCRDGKWRPVEAGTFPLAHGAPSRVGLLRGYGDAIIAPLAQAFIESYKEVRGIK